MECRAARLDARAGRCPRLCPVTRALMAALLVTACLSVAHADPARPARQPNAVVDAVADAAGFDVVMTAEVLATALEFMQPRTLEPIPLPQLALWGLRGLTTMDPGLQPEVEGNTLRLLAATRVVMSRPVPRPTDVQGWSDAAAAMAAVASNVSPAVQRAGTAGVIQSFFDELFNHFDPYSRYVPPPRSGQGQGQGAVQPRQDGGPGLDVVQRNGQMQVGVVNAGGPAAAAGIEAGERLLAIDGQTTARMDPAAAAAALAGPEGSEVELTVASRRRRPTRIVLERARVPPETVFPTQQNGLLVLRITSFGRDTGQRLSDAMLAGLAQPAAPGAPGVRGVVFDLRGNRGGLLRQAVAVAETVLSGAVVAMTAGRDPASDHLLRASPNDLTNGLPIVVLVDGRTASAAEIVASALADQGRGVVVGSSTLGKGLVQTIAPLPDGGQLYVTWSRVLAPQGWPIQGLGVLPQLCTSLGADTLQRQEASLSQGRNQLAQALAQQRTARPPVSTSQVLTIRAACPAAEGRDADLGAARFLIDTPAAYQAALLPVTALNK